MNKTIQVAIGIVVAVIFFGIAFYYSSNSLYGQEEAKIKDFEMTKSGTNLIITFKTTEAMQGVVSYSVGGTTGTIKLTEFDTVHRAEFDGSAYSGQTFEAYIEACDPLGGCETSQKKSEVI